MMRCMVTAANLCTLTECEENVMQLHAVLSQEDLGMFPQQTFPQQMKEKPPAKVRMATQGYQGQGTAKQGYQGQGMAKQGYQGQGR